jgi:antitoxin HigA-1
MSEYYNPITPGEYLEHEFLEPLNISQSKLARDIDVPVSRINGIVKGTRTITADTALRFAEYFTTSANMWLNLQTGYDLRLIKHKNWQKIKSHIRPLNRKIA